MDSVSWEVSIVVDTAARHPVGTASNPEELEALYLEAQRRIRTGEYIHPTWKQGAVLVQRTDQTLEARREAWEASFYDVTRNGAKRRRYKRPAIEREWEDMVKRDRKAAREAAKVRNAGRG